MDSLAESRTDLDFWKRFLIKAKTKDHVKMAREGIKFAESQIDYYTSIKDKLIE
jgi:hypothetical protein